MRSRAFRKPPLPGVTNRVASALLLTVLPSTGQGGQLFAAARSPTRIFFDCQDGNPNGDHDADNSPRFDPESFQGLVTDVCLRRKIRDYVHHMFSFAGACPAPLVSSF
ncbi:MAG: CRISPR-associated protein Csd2 [Acidobacteriaceae bacterium]|jgi:CRISPR-associated protein Cas7|nr:CRISPR-associated protein Csd2 [Acidobacteriaceae bacterium]